MASRSDTRVRRRRASGRPQARRVGARTSLRQGVRDAFDRHHLLTYAAAIAFQALVALVPLSLLGLGLLGLLGLEDVWTDAIATRIEDRVTRPVFEGIDFSAKRVLAHGTSAALVGFALSLWYLTTAMRSVIEALGVIHDARDGRPYWRRLLIAAGLAVVAWVGLVASFLVVVAAPRAGEPLDALLSIARWLVAIMLMGVVIGVIVRFAPAERPQTRWASAGSALVVAAWTVASILFALWARYVADFTSPVRTLLGLLLLTSYVYVSAIVFLAGVQVDELLRKRTGGRVQHVFALVRDAVRR